MQEHMRKHHTKAVSITFNGPLSMVEEALKTMRALGFDKVEDSIPWRDSEHFQNLPVPGVNIAGLRYREGITQEQLSRKTGIPRRHISEMENGKRPIGKAVARKLAEVFNVDMRLLLS